MQRTVSPLPPSWGSQSYDPSEVWVNLLPDAITYSSARGALSCSRAELANVRASGERWPGRGSSRLHSLSSTLIFPLDFIEPVLGSKADVTRLIPLRQRVRWLSRQ